MRIASALIARLGWIWHQSRRRPSCAALLVAVLSLVVLDRAFPPKTALPPDAYSVLVTDRYGHPLYSQLSTADVWRYPVTLDQVSPHYLEALIEYEDRWFYQHPGINPLAMSRALWQNMRSQEVVSGASTLTMQVARMLHPYAHQQTGGMRQRLLGKLYQVARAIQLEIRLSKDEILTLYVNLAPFGGVIEGVEAASYSYLQKPASQLTPAEAALLAVLPQAPSRLRPDRYPDAAQAARDKVIDRLVAQGAWSDREASSARLESVENFVWQRPQLGVLLAQKLVRDSSNRQQLIRSTLDAALQANIEQVLREYVAQLPDSMSGAVLVIDNSNMQVISYAGSADLHNRARSGYVDMIQAVRSPGSALKPFLYGIALDQELIHSASLLVDADRIRSAYRPANFSGAFSGPVSASQALQWSLNVPAVNLLEKVGSAAFSSRLNNAGLRTYYPAGAEPSLAMILGGVGVTMEQLTQTYTALARQGRTQPLVYRLDQTSAHSQQAHLLSPEAAWIIYHLLEDQPQPGEVTHSALHNKADFAWKTGTSYGYRDAWAFGTSPKFTIGVWVGRPDGTPSPGQYGAETAAPLMFQVAAMVQGERAAPLARPSTVSQVDICWPLGLHEAQTPTDHCLERHSAWTINGVTPPTQQTLQAAADLHVGILIDPETGQRTSRQCQPNAQLVELALWPLAAEPWVPTTQRRSTLLGTTVPQCQLPNGQTSQVQIQSPVSDTRLLNPATETAYVTLHATSDGLRQYWFINGQHQYTLGPEQHLSIPLTQAGEYQFQVFTDESSSDVVTVTLGRP